MKKALAYARYSSDQQTENSIEAQTKAIREYCKRESILLVHTYIDRAETGTNVDRDGFQDLMLDVKVNNYDYIIFHKSDRLARNRIESIIAKKDIRDTGAEVIFIVGGNYDSDTPEGMMMESMVESMDQYYSMNLSRETKKGMNNIAKKGLHTGGIPPIGLDVNENKEYVINTLEAVVVRRIFELFNENYGYKRIAQMINSEGHRTKAGRTFSASSIHTIVRNEKYIGTAVYNKHRRSASRTKRDDVIKIDNAFEAIIDKSVFLMAQSKLSKNTKPRMVSNRHYILTGKLECECGAALVGNTYGSGKYRYHWYACTNMRSKAGCDVKAIKADEVERLAIELIVNEILTEDFIDILSERVNDYNQEMMKDSSGELRDLNSNKSKIENSMNRVLDLFLDDIITKDQLEERTFQNKNDLAIINHRISELDAGRVKMTISPDIKAFIMKHSVHEILTNKKLATLYVNEFLYKIKLDHDDLKFTYKFGDAYGVRTRECQRERLVS